MFVPPEETDVLGQTRPSYHDYVQLWMEMMDPTKLKVDGSVCMPLDEKANSIIEMMFL